MYSSGKKKYSGVLKFNVMLTITTNAYNNNYNKSKNASPKNVSFGYRLPEKIFFELKDIPQMKCGCCGNDMLQYNEITSILKTFAAGSKRALENSALDRYRDSEAFSFLKKLSLKNPKVTIRGLLSNVQAGAEMRDLPPRTQIDIMHIALISDGITVKAPRVMQKLEKYKDCFSDDLKEVLNLMEIYALKYPKNTFSEIFRKPEIAEYHSNIATLNKKQLTLKKIDVFKKLRDLSVRLSPEDRKSLQETNSSAMAIMNMEYYKPHIKKGLVEDLYKSFMKNCSDKTVEDELMKAVDEFPYGIPYSDIFINSCNIERKTDMDIVKRFLNELQETEEHIMAQIAGGGNEKSNKILLCKKCNSERSSLPYPFFLRFHPEMKQNLQKQINKVITFIKHRKLVGYDDYPVDVKQNLLDQSDNILKININKYLQYREEQAVQNLERAKAELAGNEEKFKETSLRLNAINARLEEIMAIVRQIKKERHSVLDEYNSISSARTESQKRIKDSLWELRSVKELKEADVELNQSIKKKIKEANCF